MTSLQIPSSDELEAAVADRVVLISGAASGIGLATAKLFAAAKAQVIGVDVGSEERLAAAASEIGSGAVCYPCDVSSWQQQLQLFQDIVKKYDSIDIAFLNAGTHKEMRTVSGGPDEETANQLVECNYLADEQDDTGSLKEPSQNVFQVNFMGVLYGMKLAAYHMKRQKHGGRIIATVSANAYLAIPSSPQYDASKHAVLGLMRSTAQRPELQKASISVSALCPSMTRTSMTDIVASERLQGIKTSEPRDVAQAVAWLISHPQEEVNGKTVMVKGQELREVENSYRGWMYPLFAG